MELVLIVTAAGIIGLAARYSIPGRDRHGLALMPTTAIMIGSIAWTLCIWVGLSAITPWPWVISLGLTTLGVIAQGIILPKRRDAADQALWDSLTRQG